LYSIWLRFYALVIICQGLTPEFPFQGLIKYYCTLFQDGIYEIGKAHMRSVPFLRRFSGVSFKILTRGRLYLTLHCHQPKDFCIKMGSNLSHFNELLFVKGKVTRHCPQFFSSILKKIFIHRNHKFNK